jgi:hypothetical protein
MQGARQNSLGGVLVTKEIFLTQESNEILASRNNNLKKNSTRRELNFLKFQHLKKYNFCQI